MLLFFLYSQIYCRYGAPGEFILHDGGTEFCNQVASELHKTFGCNVKCTLAGRPQGNGQTEDYVKKFKTKFRCFLLQNGKTDGKLGANWDEVDFHSVLFALRATIPSGLGSESTSLLLTRPVLFPRQLATQEKANPTTYKSTS